MCLFGFYGFDVDEYWCWLVVCVFVVEVLVEYMGEDMSMVYMVGLLYGVGMVVIDEVFFVIELMLIFVLWVFLWEFVDVEWVVLGFMYVEVGVMLLCFWNFLVMMVEFVCW